MGPTGPAPITRLVLCGHMLFMDRDGSRCHVGVRHLALVTGLNKNTVAKHRADAIKLGWLVVVRSSTSRATEIQAAMPDNISDDQSSPLSCETGQSVSSAAGHSASISHSQVSTPSDATVLFHASDCPTGRYIPLIPLLPLKNRNSETLIRANSDRIGLKQQRKLQSALQAWVINDELAQKYAHDIDTLARLIPLEWRFLGYEAFIQQVIDQSRKP
jgi:hypothetical protein